MNSRLFLTSMTAGLIAAAAHAGPRTSANYTIATDTADAGGRRTTSANYTNDGSLGGVAGISTVAAPAETAKHGYLGQLSAVTGLVLSATPPRRPDQRLRIHRRPHPHRREFCLPPAPRSRPRPTRPEARDLQPALHRPNLHGEGQVQMLTAGGWTPITGGVPSDAGAERTMTDLSATGAAKFYQVEIVRP